MDGSIAQADLYALPPEEAERGLRVQLAAAYRMVDYYGWTEQIYGHLTARVPGPEALFLINPFGLNYDEVTASNLVKIDCDGNIVAPSDYPINRAGFVIHSAVHLANSDEHKCVMHTHTRAGMAIAAIKEGLQPISMASTGYYKRLSYHDYEGVSLDTEEREGLLADLGENSAMMLRNHGILTTGRTVPEAFQRLYRLERACQIQVDAAAAGTLNLLSDNVAQASAAGLGGGAAMHSDRPPAGSLEFAAMMRKMDKIDPSYRE
ncbi:MAG: class II aldolase/adducin family protein [Alphaproteobacteria bacterium]|nr:class II aldolase/adducin family protein [Alphaproteobacteria bacterium]